MLLLTTSSAMDNFQRLFIAAKTFKVTFVGNEKLSSLIIIPGWPNQRKLLFESNLPGSANIVHGLIDQSLMMHLPNELA
jgi:hypothetical protein